jgi:DNA polymerase III epsilon subunit-like protein
MSRYAVVGIETTGLSPVHHHRVLDIAVVLVDDTGAIVHKNDGSPLAPQP